MSSLSSNRWSRLCGNEGNTEQSNSTPIVYLHKHIHYNKAYTQMMMMMSIFHPVTQSASSPALVENVTLVGGGNNTVNTVYTDTDVAVVQSFADLITSLAWAGASNTPTLQLIDDKQPETTNTHSFGQQEGLTEGLLKATEGLSTVSQKLKVAQESLVASKPLEKPLPLTTEDKAWLEALKNQPNTTLTVPNPLLQPIQHFWALEDNRTGGSNLSEGFASSGLKYAYALSEKLQAQLAEGYKSGRPVRITVDDTLAIVFKIKGKQVNAEFLSTNGADTNAMGLLAAQLEQLKQTLLQKQLPVGQLSMRQATQQGFSQADEDEQQPRQRSSAQQHSQQQTSHTSE